MGCKFNAPYRYLYGPAVDMIMARLGAEGDIAWYLGDHLGTVRDLADTSGQVIDHIAYDSFGGILAETNPAVGDRFKFTAREFDAAIEQYYYRARYYDATTGRFTSEDPLGLAAGDANVYRYVLNRPTLATDPTGELMDPPGNGYYSSWGAAVLAQGAAAGTGAAAQYPPIEAFGAAESPSGPTPTPYVASAARASSPASQVRLKSANLVAIHVKIGVSRERGGEEGKRIVEEILKEVSDKLTDIADLPKLPLQWQAATFGITVANNVFLEKITISGVFQVESERRFRLPDPPVGPGGWGNWIGLAGGGTQGVLVPLHEELLGENNTGMLINDPKLITEFNKAYGGAWRLLFRNRSRLAELIKGAFIRETGVTPINGLSPAQVKVPKRVAVYFSVDLT